MAAEDLSYRDYWNILKRRWHLAAALAGAGALLGIVLAYYRAPKPVYQATAVVSYGAHRGFELPGAPIEVSPTSAIQAQRLMIRGPQVLGAAAKQLGMLPEETPRESYVEHQAMISRLARHVFVAFDPGGRSGVINIQAWENDPDGAARIANAVAFAYQQENRFELARHIVQRRDFIQKQIAANEKDLNDAQLEYELYRREHPAAAIPPGTEASISNVAKAQAAARSLAEKVNETRRQIELVRDGRAPSDIGLQLIVGATPTARLQQLSKHYTQLNVAKARLLTELTEVHPAVIQKENEIASVRGELEDELQLILDAFEKQQQEELARIEWLREQEKNLPQEAMRLAQLARAVKVYENVQIQLREQLEDALLKEAGVTGQVGILSAATPIPFPINPPPYLQYGGLGLGAGAVLGFLIALLIEGARFSPQSLRDIEEALDVPVLAVNPAVSSGALRAWTPGSGKLEEGGPEWTRSMALAALLAPRSAIGEAFRTLRANLQARIQNGDKAFTVTATGPGEGVTTTAVNLALSCAQAGQRVLLVEADFRNPAISSLLGLPREPGLSDLVLGSCDLRAATRSVADFVTGTLTLDEVLLGPGVDQFHVVPCGRLTEHSGELLGSEAFAATLEKMRSQYDVIVFDSPSLAVAADALALGRHSGILLVYDPRKTDRSDLEGTLAQLRKADCAPVGLFVNGMEVEAAAAEPVAAPASRAAL